MSFQAQTETLSLQMLQQSPHKAAPVSAIKRKTSVVWKYFTETDTADVVKCNTCNRECSIKSGSTGNLMRHMRLVHPLMVNSMHAKISHKEESYILPNETSEMVEENQGEPVHAFLEIQCETTAETAKSASVVEGSPNEHEPMSFYIVQPVNASKANEIDLQTLRTVVKEFYPFSLTGSEEFTSFVSRLNPNFTTPSYKCLTKKMLPQIYQCTVDKVKSILATVASVALTIDKGASINGESYITVTAHYLKDDLKLEAIFLDCIFIHKSCSNNIAVYLQELIANWRLTSKIAAVVTENDPVLTEAIKECQWQHIPCFAHALNTIVQAGLTEIGDLLTKVRNIVNYFKKNSDAMTQFFSLQSKTGLTNFKLTRDVPMQWNSTFDMITRFLKNKEIFTNQKLEELPVTFSQNDWTVLENVVKLLVAFNTITVEICSEKVVPLSKVPYMVRFMIKHVTNIVNEPNLPKEVRKMGNKLKEGLTTQCSDLEANDVICQSVLLDPRLKKRGFPENSFNTAYSSLLKEVIAIKREKINKMYDTKSLMQYTKPEYFIDMWSEFRENGRPPDQNLTPDATVEIDVFLSEAYVNMKDDPMTYWGDKMNQEKFPALFELARNRLCVPATSIPCEHLFSKAGNALREKRNFLTSGKLREILFLHQNL